MTPLDDHEYRPWDTIFHLDPPEELTRDEWWLGLKMRRITAGRTLPLRDAEGIPFRFATPDRALELLHHIDQHASGSIGMGEAVVNPATRDKYLVSSLAEEAIRSSQLEGASTTRRVAREMLRTGRAPRDRSERMIANNYTAMEFVRELRESDLTPALIRRVHTIITEGTLDDPADAGRLQQPGDARVRVWDEDQVLHVPPPAEQLPGRMDALCDFANGKTGSGFVHPVVRAVVVHFWLAYDHPFADGNGRTARALFYWSMLRQGYWLAEFLAISAILREAPSRYAKSFLYTETDDNDLTYFLLYHLEVVDRAIHELREYLARKAAELRNVERLAKDAGVLNHRQLALVGHATRNPDASYTIQSHRRSHGVVYQTARTDLLRLVDLGLLSMRTVGKAFRFSPSPDLEPRLRSLG